MQGKATSDFECIRKLLRQKADPNARLRLISYEGTASAELITFMKERCWRKLD